MFRWWITSWIKSPRDVIPPLGAEEGAGPAGVGVQLLLAPRGLSDDEPHDAAGKQEDPAEQAQT
jgi:hypothetical protein